MQKLVSQLSVRLIFKQLKVATVESCTGGWIGKELTDKPGSSQWFSGGVITYSNEAKSRLANVPESLIDKYGAVSIQVAEAMALGAQRFFPGHIIVAVSGVAGPDGGTLEKPVGTVCIATCYSERTNVKRYLFDGNRESIRRQTVEQAILMVLDTIENRTST